jgi:membrane protein
MREISTKSLKEIFFKLKDAELAHFASSLSFHTILSLIPVLLISLSIFTNLPSFDKYYDKIKGFIFSSLMPTHKELFASYLDQFLDNTVGLGVFGFIFVLFVSTMFFQDYESVMAKIFHTKKRGFWSAVSTYWTLLTLSPLALGISFYLSNYIKNFLESYGPSGGTSILGIFPFLIIWGLMLFIFKISTTHKTTFKSAFVSSFVTSLAWYTSKSLFVYYVVYNKTYMSIYGSFSAILFLFIWIYLSWMIFLYGIKFFALLNETQTQPAEHKVL